MYINQDPELIACHFSTNDTIRAGNQKTVRYDAIRYIYVRSEADEIASLV